MRRWCREPALLFLLAGCSPSPPHAPSARAAAPVYVAPPPADAGTAPGTPPPGETAGDPGPVEWGHDVDAALAQSQSDGHRVLVFFSAAWAMASTELERTTLSSSAVRRRLNSSYHAVKVDLTDDEGPAHKLMERFRVQGVPMLLILDGSGREIDRVTGYIDAAKLLPRLR